MFQMMSMYFMFLIARDSDIGLKSNTKYCGSFINMLVEISFVSLITKPTRCTNTSSTHIEHTCSNIDGKFHYFSFKFRVTDQFLTVIHLSQSKRISSPLKRHIYFGNLVTSPYNLDELIEIFNTEVFRIYNTCYPLRTKQYTTHWI